MSRFCASCGTEVDETAIFCPTCGQPIDQDVESAIPAAPAWPDPPAAAAPAEAPIEPTRPVEPARDDPPRAASVEPAWGGDPPPAAPAEPAWDEPAAAPARPAPVVPDSSSVATEPGTWEQRDRTARADPSTAPDVGNMQDVTSAVAAQPPPPVTPQPSAPTAPGPEGPRPSPMDSVGVTRPVTLSGWLIGVGAGLAAIGALVALFDGVRTVVDLLVLVAMAAVAVSVFFSSRLPAFGHLRLATLAIVLVALGAITDRILAGVGDAGELLMFMGAAAAVIGVVLLETGRDQPLGES